MNTKALKKQFAAAIAMVLVAAIAVGSATYAWFVNNTRVTAAEANLTATTADYLLISGDNSSFGTSMELDTRAVTLTPVSVTDGTLKAATPTFYKVKNNDQNAWVDAKANVFEAAAETDYYHDTIYLKSSTANATVKAKINVTLPETDATHAEEAIYIALVPVTDGTTYGTPIIYQLADTNNAGTTSGANTAAGDSTTDNYTTKGIKSLGDDGTITSDANMDALTITNTTGALTELSFTTLTDADTSYQFEVYMWLEGTDPQCYNTIASKTDKTSTVKVSLEFYTGDYPTDTTTTTPTVTYTKYTVTSDAANLTENDVYYLGSDGKWYSDSEGKSAVDDTTSGYLNTALGASKLTESVGA